MNNVKKYKTKPVVVEAFLLKDLSYKTVQDAWEFMEQPVKLPRAINSIEERRFDDYMTTVWKNNGISISTLKGIMLAQEGDYIIKGIKGEFRPCKPDIFEQTYDLVEE